MTAEVPPADGQGARTLVVKVGSSTVTTAEGAVDGAVVERLSAEIAALHGQGDHVVVVSSGAVALGWADLGGGPRPSDPAVLQAVSAVGQLGLMRAWHDGLGAHRLRVGQVLLAPLDFVHRQQYLHARGTLSHLLDLGVVPVVNENDAVADEEIRFGDNDRLAALVAHLVRADALVLLTDTPGLLTADPGIDREASLIEEVVEIDQRLEALAGGPGSAGVGRGGMASKLAAAKMATWSGVQVVIADGQRPGVLAAVVAGEPGAGTIFRPRPRSLSARKLWIAFAVAPAGTLRVDAGAVRALVERGRSLLAAGVTSLEGGFVAGDAVEIVGPDGAVVAKGLVRYPADRRSQWLGRRSDELPEDLPVEVVHRDDLVVLG